jgi:8-oxo-dGTP pyrophosphatase MutT (NUDIX family)
VDVASELAEYRAVGEREQRDLAELLSLVSVGASAADPWDRTLPLHLTSSALVVDLSGGATDQARLLLRWHARQQRWLQVGGHADPGETRGLGVALREAREETGLHDLCPVVPGLVHVAIVDVLPGKGEPAHRHGDLRYLLGTEAPDSARAEDEVAALRWLTFDQALAEAGEDNTRALLERARQLLQSP